MNDSSTLPEKRCTKCGEKYPATPEYFHRNKARRDGLDTWCRACKCESARVWRAAHPERVRENNRVWSAANQERKRAATRAWATAHPARVREKNRAWYAANAERVNEGRRTRYAANPERTRARNRILRTAFPERHRKTNRAWRAANLERKREADRAYRAANPDRRRAADQNRRARKRNLPNTFTAEQARFALDYFHHSCAYCGRQFHDLFNERTLAFDHFIPLSSPDCPGTTAANMLPVCHGVDGCNTSKQARDPEEWLAERFGKRKAREVLTEIETYFDIVQRGHLS